MTSQASNANNPLRISIITPSLNRVQYIADAIESVLAQNYPDFEHIIIDGGSTDGTLDLIAKYTHLQVISERDDGMYDALNKGLALATGDVIGFLNTDDVYVSDAFTAIANGFSSGPAKFVVGQAGVFHDANESKPHLFDNGILGQLLEKSILGDTPLNAFFFHKKVFSLIGIFDPSYKIVGDREFILRMAITGLAGREIPQVLYYYRVHPDSLTFDINDEKTQALVDEQLLWSEKFLRRPNMSSETKQSLSELRTRGTIRVCGHCIRGRNVAGALYYMREGLRYNPFWFYRFFKHALIHPIRQKLGLAYRTP